jgi:hypothetical protein
VRRRGYGGATGSSDLTKWVAWRSRRSNRRAAGRRGRGGDFCLSGVRSSHPSGIYRHRSLSDNIAPRMARSAVSALRSGGSGRTCCGRDPIPTLRMETRA